MADSTNVNFGRNEGTDIHLQVLLQKPLLAVECVHHTEELPAKRVMEVVSERPSTSPEDKMFANIIEAWNKIMDADSDDAVYRTFDWAAHTAHWHCSPVDRRWQQGRFWPGPRRPRS